MGWAMSEPARSGEYLRNHGTHYGAGHHAARFDPNTSGERQNIRMNSGFELRQTGGKVTILSPAFKALLQGRPCQWERVTSASAGISSKNKCDSLQKSVSWRSVL